MRTLAALLLACSLSGCAAFDKMSSDEEAALAVEQIQGIGNTAGAMLPPPFNYAAGATTALVLLVAGIMRGKKKPEVKPA